MIQPLISECKNAKTTTSLGMHFCQINTTKYDLSYLIKMGWLWTKQNFVTRTNYWYFSHQLLTICGNTSKDYICSERIAENIPFSKLENNDITELIFNSNISYKCLTNKKFIRKSSEIKLLNLKKLNFKNNSIYMQTDPNEQLHVQHFLVTIQHMSSKN